MTHQVVEDPNNGWAAKCLVCGLWVGYFDTGPLAEAAWERHWVDDHDQGQKRFDWRLMGQEEFLLGVQLARVRWPGSRTDADHDHCEFCMATFSAQPDNLNIGWTTSDSYHWVCDACYSDFQEQFRWSA